MANFLFLGFVFLFGTIFGSFLNSLIFRLEIGENFLKGRSFCPHCKHILSWKDLIPIFSFLILKGKCRYCQKKISWQYPLVEFTTGILFLLTAIFSSQSLTSNIQFFFQLIYQWLIVCCLVVVFVYDLKHYLIPDEIIYPAIFLSLLYQIFGSSDFNVWNFLLAVLPSLFFLALILISKEKWLGWGDFKLSILMGIFLGWPKILVALVLAFFIGAIFSLGLIIFGKKTMKSEIPFAPFLVSATFLALFFGQKILNWYLVIFFL